MQGISAAVLPLFFHSGGNHRPIKNRLLCFDQIFYYSPEETEIHEQLLTVTQWRRKLQSMHSNFACLRQEVAGMRLP